ncbi:hypothetical protein ST20ES_78 [Mycobacterium phage 20ES]|uniref:hypothetical protein n=1 Tax=Mycobacterium phage First TaxID=1245814 RepID=UPI0002C0F13A|nr:hypothetical protein First_0077 [Mycobacterium phage First]YP_009009124.1 hypothetical protein ST20ES_78 [Mycobacterium phage 20ES]AFV51206.1 hypothetical protein First_0077 [Mycobacterium phage First]AHJ86531.1 hypothetical protein 20ES_78 [Mycobacterium phage 20ES]
MYVEDIDDLEELEDLKGEIERNLRAGHGNEQDRWDLEDINQRIEELSDEVGGSPG